MQKKGPWTITAAKTAYKNSWITIIEDQVIRPDGKPGIFITVTSHPGVSVLPIDEQGNVFLIEEYRYAIEAQSIEAPSGRIETEETIVAGAKRELEEETGIHAEEWIDMGYINPFTSKFAREIISI